MRFISFILKHYDFVKMVDPYTAYQEMEMYLSGVFGGNYPECVEISDEQMKIKKGFGHKYAFKKEPTKRRLRL